MTTRQRTYTWSDPMALAQAGRGMSGLEFMAALAAGELGAPPIAETLGFTVAEVAAGRVVFTIEPAEYHYNPIGVVHGGVAATLADSVLGCAVQTMLPAGTGYTSLDLSVRFVRPITATTGLVRAIGETVHVGRRTATAEARLLDGADKLLATATSTCLVFPLG